MPASIVLVHGGAHGAWCWEPTIPLIDGPVLTIDLPPKEIRGVPAPDPLPPSLESVALDDWARSAIADVDAAGFDRFVLAGHSMGGLTISEVARRVPERVAHLVYVSCMVPPEGGLVAEGMPTHDNFDFRHMFCNDMNEKQTQFVLDHTGTEAMNVFNERVTRRGIPPELPKTYVRLLRDQALPPGDQDRAIANLRESPGGALDIVELDTGHDVMISAPDELAGLLNALAT